MPKNARLDLINAINTGNTDAITTLLSKGRPSTGIWGGVTKKSVLPFAELNGNTPFHLMATKGLLHTMVPYIKTLLTTRPDFIKREFYTNREEDSEYQAQIKRESNLTDQSYTMSEAQATNFLKICLNKTNHDRKTVFELCVEQDQNYLKENFPDLIKETTIKTETFAIAPNDENQHPNHKEAKVPTASILEVKADNRDAEAAFDRVKELCRNTLDTQTKNPLGTDYTTLELFIWAYSQDKKFASRIPTSLFENQDDFMDKFLATQTAEDFAHINTEKSLNAFGLACYYKKPITASKILTAANFTQNQQASIKEAIKWNSPEVIGAIIGHYGEQTDWQQILFSSIKNARFEMIDMVLSQHRFESDTITSIKGPKGAVEYTPENYLLHTIRKEAQKNLKMQTSSANQKDKAKSQQRFDEKIDKFMTSIEIMQTKAGSAFNIGNPKTKSLLYKISNVIDDIETNEKYLNLKNIIGDYEFSDETDNFSTSTGFITYGTGTASMMLGVGGDGDSGGEDNF